MAAPKNRKVVIHIRGNGATITAKSRNLIVIKKG